MLPNNKPSPVLATKPLCSPASQRANVGRMYYFVCFLMRKGGTDGRWLDKASEVSTKIFQRQ